MTVFYFYHWYGEAFIEDSEGLSCASLEAARARAIDGARDVLAGDVKNGRIDFNQRVELCDGAGRLCLTIPFREAVEIFGPSPTVASPPPLRPTNG